MGVPKFYRWISERYPCLSEVVKEYQIPEFDNLYLDMNGVIHTCSHPNDDDPHFRITEEKIFSDIFHYLEVLFRMIQPRKVFFMAVDGVAPRAKMNQQRGRRFRSAREAEMNEKKARDRGEDLPKEDRFDSNCITPGTPFMVRLQEQLKYFVTNKISTDSLWRNTKVVLSGHETPGEGEHKIMDYIRYEKAQPGYDPNTRHCLYGLDADLMMLGLCTHDPHFSLLREEVKFGGKKSQASKRTPTPEETTFHLLHLSLLREYLDYEFQELKVLDYYDLEHIIDDWVLMGFLVGNDFIPHLPNMHINKGALPELFTTYKTVLPTLGGYINENGKLNLVRFEKFMAELSKYELEKFDDIYSDAKWLEGKTAKKTNGRTEIESTPGPGHVYEMLEGLPEPGVNPIKPASRNADLARLMASAQEFDTSGSDEEMDPATVDDPTRSGIYQMEFRQHKRDYYIQKLGYTQVTDDILREQAEGYVRAIQWNLHYYYDGCMSWSWFYEHHFSPWITDIKNFSSMEMKFEMSGPFLPFEQLMAVLPSASKNLVPPALQWLMTSPESAIVDFYPAEFEQDLNGKQQDWEAVVLIPFIDQYRLLDAMKPIYPKMTEEERKRNIHGPMYISTFSQEAVGSYPAPAYFPTIEQNQCITELVLPSAWVVPINKLKKGLMDGVKLGVFFPGFPTLQHISHTAKHKKAQARVFEQASRGENMILTLENQGRPDITEVAKAMIGKEVWVSWPHLIEAKVMAVSNSKVMITESKTEEPLKDFNITTNETKSRYASRFGIEIGPTEILVHACAMSGRRYEMGAARGRITLEKQWHKTQQFYPLQTVVADIPVYDPSFKAYCTVEELFKPGTLCFMLGEPCYGALGSVIKIDPQHNGRIQLKFKVPEEPDLSGVYLKQGDMQESYDTAYRASQYLGLSSHVLSRLTGTIFMIRGAREQQMDSARKSNIGLNLKSNKRGEEVAGFTRKQENGWVYSKACLRVLMEYQQKFPEVFQFLAQNRDSNNDMFHECDVFEEEEADERTKELVTFLENLPTATAPRQPFGTESLSDEVVKSIEAVANKDKKSTKEMVVQVRPKLLYLPNQYAGSSLVDPYATFKLFDRVINIREGFSVSLGLRGTLIRIQKGAKAADNLYDVVFDEAFTGGLTLNCSPGRGYRLPGSALINISFKEKTQWDNKDRRGSKPRAVVKPFDGNQEYGRSNNGRQENRNNWEEGGKGFPQRAQHQYGGQQGGQRDHDGHQGGRWGQRDQGGFQAYKQGVQREQEPKQREEKAAHPVNPLLNDPEPVVLPPDPKTLPLPQGFMQNRGRGRGVSILPRGGMGRGGQLQQQEQPGGGLGGHYQQQQHGGGRGGQHQQQQMQDIWQSLQHGGGAGGSVPIAAQGPPGVHPFAAPRGGQQRGGARGRGQTSSHRGHSDHQRGGLQSGHQGGLQGAEQGGQSLPGFGRGRGKKIVREEKEPSMQQMEINIKQMLNITSKNPLTEDSKQSSGMSISSDKPSDKLRMLCAELQEMPRYTSTVDSSTGLVEGQVALDDGRNFTSAHLMATTEEAYESAAARAVSALQTERSLRSVIGAGSKGQQPGSYRQSSEESDMSGQPGSYQKSDRNPFVPLQVAKRAVKSKEKDELEQYQPEPNPLFQQDGADTRRDEGAGGVRGVCREKRERRGRGRAQRKNRLAANFGGNPE